MWTNLKTSLNQVSLKLYNWFLAIEKGEDCLKSRIYNHKFRNDRERTKDISPNRFDASSFKTQEDRLKLALADAEGWITSKEVYH